MRVFKLLGVVESKAVLLFSPLPRSKNKGRAFQKENQGTFSTIMSAYEKLAGKTIQPERLLRKLKEAEKAGFIERKIMSRNDAPIVVWQSNLPTI